MKVDPHCPIDLIGYEILMDDRGNARAYLRLGNISRNVIESISAEIVWYDARGGESSASLEFRGIAVRAGERFTLTASTDDPKYPKTLDVHFEQIAFAGNIPVWRANAANVVDAPNQPMAGAEDLRTLAYWVGKDAVAFPVCDEQVWMCVCARANSRQAKHCARCGRGQSEVLSVYTREALLKKPKRPSEPLNVTLPIDPRKPMRGGKNDQVKRMLRQRALLIRRTVVMLSLAALAAILYFFAANGRYWQ